MEKDIEAVEARWFNTQFEKGRMTAEEVIHSVLMTPRQRDYLLQEGYEEIVEMFHSRISIIRLLLTNRSLAHRVKPKSRFFPIDGVFAQELTEWLTEYASYLMVGRFALQKSLGTSGGTTCGSMLADNASATTHVVGTLA